MWLQPVWKSKFYGAFVLNHRVDLHAIDATPARWHGAAGSSPLDRASTAASSPRNDLVKNCRVHPSYWFDFHTDEDLVERVDHTVRGEDVRDNDVRVVDPHGVEARDDLAPLQRLGLQPVREVAAQDLGAEDMIEEDLLEPVEINQ